MADAEVLIVGAGPTGLVLALFLAKAGVRVRIVDQVAQPGTTSRALAVHARTLELYRQAGLADAVVDRGLPFAAANFWVKGRRVARAELGSMGEGLSEFPYVVIFPQDEHERLLIDRLRAEGVTVERPVELTSFETRGDRVVARLKGEGGAEETCESAWIVGCDGARSTMREQLGEGFPGGTYSHLFYVADAQATGPVMDHELHVALDDADFLAVFPLKGDGHARFIGTVTAEAEARHAGALAWKDVSPGVIAHLGVSVERVNWLSTYHVHHRVVTRFRAGRAFLAGDAAHIHSPVGGQGMNTGIGDAINLAWKLAAVVQSRADPSILDSYEPERITFARRLVATTDRAFQLVTSAGRLAAFMRIHVVPRVLPIAFRSPAFRRVMFRTISQTTIEYRASPLSRGGTGGVRAGDRLPWVPMGPRSPVRDNYAPLAALDWQVHVYGEPAPAALEAAGAHGVPVHAFPWQDAMRAAGLDRDGVLLVRPDGYVGFAAPAAAAGALDGYLRAWGIVPRAAARTA